MTNHNKEDRKKTVTRIVCLVVAVAMLATIVGTLIYTASLT